MGEEPTTPIADAQPLPESAPTGAESGETAAPPMNGEKDSPPDYQALYKELQAQGQEKDTKLANLEHTLRSRGGATLKQRERDNVILGLGDRLGAMEKSLGALATTLVKGDTESLPEQLQQIEQEREQSATASSFQRYHDASFQALQSVLKDQAGNALLDIRTAPELEEVRAAWNDYFEKRDVGGFGLVIADAVQIAKAKERSGQKASLETERKKTLDEAKRQALKETNADDLDLGTSAPGGDHLLESMPLSATRGVKRIERGLRQREAAAKNA